MCGLRGWSDLKDGEPALHPPLQYNMQYTPAVSLCLLQSLSVLHFCFAATASYMPASPPAAAAAAAASPAVNASSAAAAVVAAAGARHLAHGASTRGSLLQESNHMLTPVAVAQLPKWVVVPAKGQELHFGVVQ